MKLMKDFQGWGSELGGQSEVNQARKGHGDTLNKIISGKTLIENFAKLKGRFDSVKKDFRSDFEVIWGKIFNRIYVNFLLFL